MARTPCCNEAGLKKGAWTSEEDQKLVAYIQEHGEGGWRTLPQKAGLQRCGKSCRLRWTNYLRPDIKRGELSTEEEQKIIQLHASLGNKWSAIARHLPKRTDNEIKNYWNTHIKKRLIDMGIDPVTHKQIGPSSTSSNDNSSDNVVEERSSSTHSQIDSEIRPIQRSISTSAKLLNKVSAKIAQMHSKEMLLSLLNSTKDNNITAPSHSGDGDDSDIEILESAPKIMSKQISRSGSNRILNKMATKLVQSKSIDLSKIRLDVVLKQSLESSSTIRGSIYNNIGSPISVSEFLESMPTPSSACESSEIFTRNLSMGEDEVNEAFQAIGSSHSPMHAPEMVAYEIEEYLGNYGGEDGAAILNNENNNNVSQNNKACDSQFDMSMGPTDVEYSDFIEHFTNMPFGGDYVNPTIDYYCGEGESNDGIMNYWNEDSDLGNYAMQ